jgi:hypothetical protein
MLLIETYWSVFFELFDRFLDLRTTPARWADTLAGIQTWVGRRASSRL